MDEMTKAQKAFQEWYEAEAMPLEHSNWFRKDANGDYEIDTVQWTWKGWQAALAAQPAAPGGEHYEALLTFFRWAMNNGPFDGCSLDGGDVQDKAEHLGLIVPTKYDPKVHGERYEFDEGDDFYVFAPALSTNTGEQKATTAEGQT